MNNTYDRILDLVIDSNRTDEVSQGRIASAIEKRKTSDLPAREKSAELSKQSEYHTDRARGEKSTGEKSKFALNSKAAGLRQRSKDIDVKVAKSTSQQDRVAKMASDRKKHKVFTDPKDK